MGEALTRADEVATCRGCRQELRGKPYWAGGQAFHPITGEQCPANFYGGFVCSYGCDRRVSLEMENSMPGAGRSRHLSSEAQRRLQINWPSDV